MDDKWLPMPRYKLRKDLVRRILKQEALAGKRCLEIGYGSGDMLLLFAELGLTSYGYDVSEGAREHARARIKKYPELQERIKILRERNELIAKRYDYLMAFEVLEHIEDDVSCLKDWRDLLHDGGKLFISVPAHVSKWGASDIAVGHYRRYEREDMNRLLTDTGFKILSFWNYGWPISILLDIFLHRKYRVESGEQLSKQELSEQSGINRKNNLVNRMTASDFFLAPFLFMQLYFLNKDLSSAYLIFAEKVPCEGKN